MWVCCPLPTRTDPSRAHRSRESVSWSGRIEGGYFFGFRTTKYIIKPTTAARTTIPMTRRTSISAQPKKRAHKKTHYTLAQLRATENRQSPQGLSRRACEYVIMKFVGWHRSSRQDYNHLDPVGYLTSLEGGWHHPIEGCLDLAKFLWETNRIYLIY